VEKNWWVWAQKNMSAVVDKSWSENPLVRTSCVVEVCFSAANFKLLKVC
jgi:hypothetical protein